MWQHKHYGHLTAHTLGTEFLFLCVFQLALKGLPGCLIYSKGMEVQAFSASSSSLPMAPI